MKGFTTCTGTVVLALATAMSATGCSTACCGGCEAQEPPADAAAACRLRHVDTVRRFEFSTETTVPASLLAAGPLDVWIPAPTEGGMQRPELLSLGVAGTSAPAGEPPAGVRVERTTDERQGNAMLHVRLPAGLVEDVGVRATWSVERRALPARGGDPDGSGRQDVQAALAPDRLVPLDGEVAALAAEVPDGPDVDATARA
jgi:hypothetical protein